jgi:uncharacterized protein (DUF433 family)
MIDWDENKILMAFTVEQAAKLSGLSRGQLASWDRSGFFLPSFADDNRRRSFSRVYTFRDVACLRVLHVLRNESRVSLQELRAVKDKLSHLGDDLWSKTTLYVLNRRVIIDNPDNQNKEEVVSGQGIVNIPLKVVTGQLQKEVEDLKKRDQASVGRIVSERGIAQNKPTVAGTRISVETIKAFDAAGYSVEQIIKEYPSLTPADIEAALQFGKVA